MERLRSAEALRESGELYRAYFTASPIALFVSDTRGQYLEVNGAACALTGYGREELVGMSIADVLAGEDARRLAERLVGLLALGSGRGEIRIRRKDGSVRHCLVHALTIGADRLLGLLLDITDRKEAEEKLRESEERFRSLSEAAFEAILVHDGGRIVDVNQALCELGGYSWHELVGRDGFELIAPEQRELVYRNLLAEYDRPYEIEVRRRDGTRIPVEVQGRSFPYRGQVQRVVAIRDIRERKKSERVRESLIRELEAKNAELERFGYTVTHDLKAPLVTIRGFADYLEKDAREGRTDRLAADAARIAEAVGKLQRQLDELFELSRAGRPVGPPVAVAAADLVQEALRLVRGRPGARERGSTSPGLCPSSSGTAPGSCRCSRTCSTTPSSSRRPPPSRGSWSRRVRRSTARPCSSFGTTGSASSRATASACSTSSRSSTPGRRGPAWAWPWSSASSSRTAEGRGSSRRGRARGRRPA